MEQIKLVHLQAFYFFFSHTKQMPNGDLFLIWILKEERLFCLSKLYQEKINL